VKEATSDSEEADKSRKPLLVAKTIQRKIAFRCPMLVKNAAFWIIFAAIFAGIAVLKLAIGV
jgi:hypothetical protein